jgi:VanZ family protein
MHFFIRFVRKYPFSLLCVLLIWALSLTPFFPETPFDNVQFIDKWTHLVMYGGTCSVIWMEYLRSHHRIEWCKVILLALVGMILLGGLMELLQAYCTTTRSGEWLDFWADTVGVLLGNGVGLISSKLFYS